MKYSIEYTPAEYNYLGLKTRNAYRLLHLQGKPSERVNLERWLDSLTSLNSSYCCASSCDDEIGICLTLCVPVNYTNVDIQFDVKEAKKLLKQ